MKKLKYYVEISNVEYGADEPYMSQSEWFNTEKQAIKWAKGILYLSDNYAISLMVSEWDLELDTYTDIEFLRDIRKEIQL